MDPWPVRWPIRLGQAMVTIAHTDFYSYVPPGGTYRDGQEDIDGTIVTQAFDGTPDRPSTFQEAKGHGAFAWDGGDFPGGGDGVVFYPSRTASRSRRTATTARSPTAWVSIFDAGGLWERRFNPETFASFGAFLGDDGKDNAANAPWGWDDGDDGSDLQGGEHATDPAKLVAIYFSNLGDFSRDYVRNQYRS